MGFTEVLTIVFVVLKLVGVINWAWWLVLLPEIIMFAIYVAAFFWGVFDVFGAMRVKKRVYREWR